MNESLTVSSPKDLLSYLTKSRSAIEMALPKHLNSDRMLRLALTCFSTNPKLRNCSAQSILASIVVASQLGLEPGVAGQGYLIPYKNTCTFVPGWQGLVGLLNNTGRATAWTGSVFDGDKWEFELGSQPKCHHIPGPNYGDSDKIAWAYACGKVNGSEQPVVEAWPISRVWRHRDRFNRIGRDHYSFQHPEMYARKVVLLQVLKYMPRSIELNNAIVAADAVEAGRTTTIEAGCVIEVDPAGEEKEAKPKTRGPVSESDFAPVGISRDPAPDYHVEMQSLLDENGLTFTMLQMWGDQSGSIEDATKFGSLQEIPSEVLERLLKSRKKMVESLKVVKEGMAR